MWIEIISEENPNGMLIHFNDEDLGRIYVKKLGNTLDSERYRLHIECKGRETFTVDSDKDYILELYDNIYDYIAEPHNDGIVNFDCSRYSDEEENDEDHGWA